MPVEFQQASITLSCSFCERRIIQGSLYLYTHGFGSWNYCQHCTIKRSKYSWNQEDFKHFRPEEANLFYYDFKDKHNLEWDQRRTLRELYKI